MIEKAQLLVLIGVVLILFFAILLLTSKKYKSYPNKFLAASFIMLAIIILKMDGLLEHTALMELFEFFRIEYLFSVFLYFYVFATLKEHIKPSTFIFLTAPFVMFSAIYSFFAIADWYEYEPFVFIEKIEPFEIYIIIFFNSAVVFLFTEKVKKSNTEKSFKKWIYVISIGLIIVLASFLTLELVEILLDIYYWRYLGIVISIFFIGVAYLGVQQLQIEEELKSIKKINNQKSGTAHKTKSKIAPGHFQSMQLLMEEKELFKDPNLDREALASILGLSSSSVTRILKEEAKLSFTDFITKYRIALAKKMLIDEQFNIFSLEAIGKEVGFKSRSTFYESFRKEVGVSPGVFKKN